MKLRNGFVSNSSSASFIVAIRKTGECPHCKRNDPNFLDFIEGVETPNDYECTKMHARGAERIIEWAKDNTGYAYNKPEDNKEWDDIFEKVKEAEAKGLDVGAFSIGYHDEVTNNEWYHQKNHGAVEKIWSDH